MILLYLKEFAWVLSLIASMVKIFAAANTDYTALIVAEVFKVCSILCTIADRHIRIRRRRLNVHHGDEVEMGDPDRMIARAEVTAENEVSNSARVSDT